MATAAKKASTKKPARKSSRAAPAPKKDDVDITRDFVRGKNFVFVKQLFINPNNSKIHDEQNLTEIAASLRRFGQQKPVIYRKDGLVLAGNGTFLAAVEILGWKLIWAEESHLDSYEADAYAIADNKLSERSIWDWQTVGDTLKAIEEAGGSIADLGFPDYELEPLLNAEWQVPELEPLEGNKGGREHGSTDGYNILVTLEQYETIKRAINTLRDTEEDEKMSDGRALELICADWLS